MYSNILSPFIPLKTPSKTLLSEESEIGERKEYA